MESQMHRPYEEQPQHTGLHSVIEGEGEGEHQHGKKSVLKKVKAKARKIKDTIKHGLTHEHEIGHEHHHDEDEEEDEDESEEMIEDPEVHGAPMYESSVIRSATVPQQDVGLGPKSGRNLENPASVGEDRYESSLSDRDTVMRLVQGREHPLPEEESLAKPTAMEAHIPETRRVPVSSGNDGVKISDRSNVLGVDRTAGEPGGRFGLPEGLEEDPDAPKDRPEAMQPSNYQSKVTDPTGEHGEEAGIAPLVGSFGKMGVKDETETRSGAESEQRKYAGSHDQFAPEPFPIEGQFAPRPVPHKASEGLQNPETNPRKSYLSKPEEMPSDPIDGKPGQSSYTDKISSAASVISEKAISAKNVVASKLGYGSTGAPVTEEMHHQDKPSEQGSYTEKIASATSVIADKAAAAKNVVASKLGYGGTEGTRAQGAEASTEAATAQTEKSASPTEYAHKAAAAVTETLAPVYGKVAGVGSSVMSKVQGSGTGQESRSEAVHHEGKAKGVSMKEYLTEKLRPGEEDKALSEVIADTLHKKPEKTGETEAVTVKPIERVTESEEVARRLGSGGENKREGEDALIAGGESSGQGVVDRLKGAVTSWLGKGGESQTSQGSPGTSFVDTHQSTKG